jgi:hypothetical protein
MKVYTMWSHNNIKAIGFKTQDWSLNFQSLGPRLGYWCIYGAEK